MNGEKLPPVEGLRKAESPVYRSQLWVFATSVLLYWMPTRGGPSRPVWCKWLDLSRPNLVLLLSVCVAGRFEPDSS